MNNHFCKAALLATAAVGLASCGGGGGSGGGVASAPTPPPTSTGSTSVDIFRSPASQEFAAVGSGDDLRIRYDAATNQYEVMAEGQAWERLVDDPLFSPHPGDPNTSFALAGLAPNQSYFLIRAHHSHAAPDVRYQYSNLAAWGRSQSVGSANRVGGFTAFGTATPTSGVPISGSATYQGMIEGASTIQYDWDGGLVNAHVQGTVELNFDFGSGSLAGNIHPYLEGTGRSDLGVMAFANPVYGVGSTGFSGSFATSLNGPNAFSGLFTGPNAQELIGKWAFPFISPIDGSTASASGAWIAKKPM